jgi:cupin superfamily acireductone dioxygenase involved in methionine salvage
MKKADIIQELISITELQKKNSENSPIEIISKNSKIMKNFPPKKKKPKDKRFSKVAKTIKKKFKYTTAAIIITIDLQIANRQRLLLI